MPTPMRRANSRANSAETPRGGPPVGSCWASTELPKLMATRSRPVGASSAMLDEIPSGMWREPQGCIVRYPGYNDFARASLEKPGLGASENRAVGIWPITYSPSRLDDRQWLELAAQHAGGAGVAPPARDDGGGDAAESRGEHHVAVVELGQARHVAIRAARNRSADQEDWRRCAMIGALAGVFLHTPAEFAEYHQHHVLRPAESSYVLHEGRDVVGGVGPQPGVDVALLDMGIERIVAIRDVVDFGREVRRDQRGDPVEAKPHQ